MPSQSEMNMRDVRARLLVAGWPDVARWAAERGHLVTTVRRVIYWWWHRMDREPLGGLSRQIMRDLEADLGPRAKRSVNHGEQRSA